MRFIKLRNLYAFIFLIFSISAHALPEDCNQLLTVDNLKSNSITNQTHYLAKPHAWLSYFKKTSEDTAPRETLVTALNTYSENNASRGYAVDLGAGTGRDTLYLLQNHWRVLAIDFSPEAIDILLKRARIQKLSTPDVEVSDLSTMKIPRKVDVMNASYTLPFIEPNKFLPVWKNIVQHIHKEGIFSGNFFGVNDNFSDNANMTILTKPQIECLFKNFQIIQLQEDHQVDDNHDVWNVVAIKKE